MKKIISLLTALVLCLSLCPCSPSGKIEGSGYKTPEDAVLAYAKALKSANVSKILSTFAVETYVENYDLEAQVKDYNNYSLALNPKFSSVDSFTTDLNLLSRQQIIANNLTLLCLFSCLGEDSDVVQGRNIRFDGDPYNDPDDLFDDMDFESWSEILSEMEFDDDFVYMDDLVDEDNIGTFEDRLDQQCDYYGCDEIVPMGLELELNGEDCILFVDVACYDGKWFILRQGGMLATWQGCSVYAAGLYIEE